MEDPATKPLLQSPLNLPPTMSPSSLLFDTPPKPSDQAHISRMINPANTRSPSKPIYSDRFIPSRSGSNFALFGLSSSPKLPSADGKDEISSSSAAYTALLRAALFGPDTPEKKEESFSPARNIFRYKTETKRPLHSVLPLGFEEDEAAAASTRGPSKAQRKVARSPYKVLDAPALQDDFYLNLVDWSAHNVLAVGLGNCVYLWNACSSKVTKLCDLGIDDSVCSVGWAQRGTHLAVGTSNGKLQVWDASCCKRVRTMEGHQLRVGALAWSSSLLSSGSRDKSILQRDMRAQDDFVSKLTGHKSEVCGLKWSHDNRELASGGNDNRLFVWNQHSTQPVLRYCEHTAAVKALAWSPHLHGLLASGGGTADRCIRFWNTSTNSQLSCIDTGSQVCNLVWSKNVNELVSTHGYSQNQIIVWRYPSMLKLATLTGHTFRVLYLAISPDGQTIVTGAGDETLRFWNVFPSAKSQKLRRARKGVKSLRGGSICEDCATLKRLELLEGYVCYGMKRSRLYHEHNKGRGQSTRKLSYQENTHGDLTSSCPPGTIQIYSDASWLNQEAGLAGIALNDRGVALYAWKEKIQAISPLHAEAEALLTSIRIAIGKQWRRIRIYSDALTLTEAVNGDNRAGLSIQDAIQRIRSLLQPFESWDCVWLHREQNFLADTLSRDCRRSPMNGLWFLAGDELGSFVDETLRQQNSTFCHV